MKFVCGKMWKIFGNLLLSLIWVAGLALNVVAYVKETHWVSVFGIVLCVIWLVMEIVDIAITFRDLKRFCEKYDEQVEKLLAERRESGITTEVGDGYIDIQESAEALYDAGYRKTFTSELTSDTQKAFKEEYVKASNENADEIERLKYDYNKLLYRIRCNMTSITRYVNNKNETYDKKYKELAVKAVENILKAINGEA